jgi:hypothetical protein
MKKICPECGKEFECLHSKDCYCVKYKIKDKTMKLLKAKYNDCLCEDCLRKYAEK